ncbi:MAG: hypothetical protein K2X66_07515, partial [Cyanobacteria bacterium]|nr:hypothetical protein [Cyanobacteriota bacterium]
MSTLNISDTEKGFLQELERAFDHSNTDFARAYYLFATAKLSDTYNSQEIYQRYPLLSEESTFHTLKALYDQNPTHEEMKRLFTATLGNYIGNQLSDLSDALQNAKNQLKIPVSALNLKDKAGKPLSEMLYEDTPEWLKKLEKKEDRQALYDAMAKTYHQAIAPQVIDLFHKENDLFSQLGYPDLIEFYSQTSGHPLMELGKKAAFLLENTLDQYQQRVSKLYQHRTGRPFSEATRADISFVFHGKSEEMSSINDAFKENNLYPLAIKTFDGLGLEFSTIAKPVDFKSKEAYQQAVDAPCEGGRILLDMTKREGKRARAFVYPAKVPQEIYLSVKPEGGLDDFSTFFHESGHALHFAYENPNLSFSMALLGNNTVTESYAYLFQNLFLNKHWLTHQAGLTSPQASKVVQKVALNDLYMLRRYASKMMFELKLFDGTGLDGK